MVKRTLEGWVNRIELDGIKYITKTLKYGGRNVIVFWHGIGTLQKIIDKIDYFMYKDITKNVIEWLTNDNLPTGNYVEFYVW